jgi:hypothetical protein
MQDNTWLRSSLGRASIGDFVIEDVAQGVDDQLRDWYGE